MRLYSAIQVGCCEKDIIVSLYAIAYRIIFLLLSLNSSKTEFLIVGLKHQFSKIDNSSLNATHFARNFGFIFDEHLTFSDQISSLSKFCYSHIRELRCIRPYLDSKASK